MSENRRVFSFMQHFGHAHRIHHPRTANGRGQNLNRSVGIKRIPFRIKTLGTETLDGFGGFGTRARIGIETH